MSGNRRSLLLARIPDTGGLVEVSRTQGGCIRLSRKTAAGGIIYFTLGIDTAIRALDAIVDYTERVEESDARH